MERSAGQEGTQERTQQPHAAEEQRPARDAGIFAGRGSLPAVHGHAPEAAAAAAPTASEQAFDGGATADTTDLPEHINAHITKTNGGVEIKTDAVHALAGGTWIGRGDNRIGSQTGTVGKTGSVSITLPAPEARSMVSMDLLIQSPDRKHSYRLNCGLEAMAIGDEQTGETRITKPVRQLVRSGGGVSPLELSVSDGDAFTNRDLDHAGVKVTPKESLEGVSSVRGGRGHVHVPGARVARGTGHATVVNVETGATVTGGYLQPDGSFDLDFLVEETAKYAVQIQFEGVRYMGTSFHANGEMNPLLLLKL